MVVGEFVVGIAMIRADDAGDPRMASRGTISLNFNTMSETTAGYPIRRES